ncbi:CBS domain-containing protein [Aquibacillus halophilus]|uniref:CBS domain-containing protein n=1 Tax=Aquibacillus halophilus TaxID=930132 RepID=A0A6A8D661_9BACI|nr:nucleotidyltransferase family protein [Aquibacillus halophilus]MRH41223.1 CBS domain-containing protein [Aquibacillus halophilus]
MFDISQVMIKENMSIIEAIKQMDITSKKILLVTSEEDRLIGVITDGDVRRWILKNGNLNDEVSYIMNTSPKVVSVGDEEKKALDIMKSKFIDAVPVVDHEFKVVDVVFWNKNINGILKMHGDIDIPVVIMAGGKGTRLYPYTKILPKPLVPIGDTPIVERIINRFVEFGVKHFYMTVNYKKNMIKSYFADIEKIYDIEFIEEEKPLGTGGSLSLLGEHLKTSFFVSNCDILIDANYSDIYNYHQKNENKITMITSLKNFKIPYGVVDLDESGTINKTREKPEYTHLINTGMYIVEPDLLDYIPGSEFFHITELIDLCIEKGFKVGTYPVSEDSWLDMGQFDEMENMIKKLGIEDKQ